MESRFQVSALKPETYVDPSPLTSASSDALQASRPDAPIEPVMTEKPAKAQRRQPFELKPTADNGSNETGNGPQEKRSGGLPLGSRRATRMLRSCRTEIIH